jgi:hypothetical protein
LGTAKRGTRTYDNASGSYPKDVKEKGSHETQAYQNQGDSFYHLYFSRILETPIFNIFHRRYGRGLEV